MKNEIIIPVALTAKQFSRFARYNVFIRQRRWIRPVVFFVLMNFFAVICLLSKRDGSRLLAGVLSSIGILLPAVWFGTFFMNVRTQAKANKLSKKERSVYTVTLRNTGVHIKGETGQEADLPWKKIVDTGRCHDLTCLYLTKMQAYLLPDSCLPCTQAELAQFLSAHVKS